MRHYQVILLPFSKDSIKYTSSSRLGLPKFSEFGKEIDIHCIIISLVFLDGGPNELMISTMFIYYNLLPLFIIYC